jgi:peptidyl-prolyl cis-trans isomerase C
MNALARIRLLAGVGAAVVAAVVGFAAFTGIHPVLAQSAAAPVAPGAATPVAPGAAAAAPHAPGGGTVVTIDGEPITELDLEIAYQEFASQLGRFGADERREVTIELITHMRLIAKEAAKNGMAAEPAMAAKLKMVQDRALYSEFLDRLFAKEVTEDAARALFASKQTANGKAFEYHVRHILVPTAGEAQQVITKLEGGADFAQVAKDVSIDPGSAPDGGDLGFIAAGETVKEFETAAFSLDIGKYTKTPVESQFGFHIIKLEEKRDAAPKTFEDSIPDLQDELAQKAFQKVLDDLTAKSKIVKAPPVGVQR